MGSGQGLGVRLCPYLAEGWDAAYFHYSTGGAHGVSPFPGLLTLELGSTPPPCAWEEEDFSGGSKRRQFPGGA